jgi:hypothetical protein
LKLLLLYYTQSQLNGFSITSQGIAANIWLFGYDSKKFFLEVGNTAERYDQAKLFLSYLTAENLSQRPIFMIAHSMGGLVVKEMLGVAENQYPQIFERIRGIVFVATPHQGADIASLVNRLGLGSLGMKELHPNNADLRRLDEQYCRQAAHQNWGTLPFYEMYPTWGITIVDENSANPKAPNQEPIVAVPKDHIKIAKCNSRDELVYKLTVQFITNFIDLPIHSTPAAMQLTPEQRESFREAILSAYPNQGSLDMVLDLLNMQLLDVVVQNPYSIMIKDFVSYCQSQGKISEVLEVLYKNNSGNSLLKEFYNHIKKSQ